MLLWSSLQGKRGGASAQFVVHRRREWGNCVELESRECRRLFIGVAATGLVRPAVYTGDLNVRLYVQLVTSVLPTCLCFCLLASSNASKTLLHRVTFLFA